MIIRIRACVLVVQFFKFLVASFRGLITTILFLKLEYLIVLDYELLLTLFFFKL